MLLAKLQLTDVVTNQINIYLDSNQLTFLELKAHLLNKVPIPPVHSIVITTINQAYDADKKELQKMLETRAYNEQALADEQQKKHDQSDESKDEALKAHLTRELNHIPTQIESHESEGEQLRGKLNVLLRAQRTHSLDNSAAVLRLEKLIHSHELNIKKLHHQKEVVSEKLNQLEIRAQARINRQLELRQREKARALFKTSGLGMADTLSAKNNNSLLKVMQTQQDELEKSRAELTLKAEELNYVSFLIQLPQHLNKIKLSPPEILALQNILKLLEQHLKFAKQATLTAEMINQKKAAIIVDVQQLERLKLKAERLKNDNPRLTSLNKKYANSNAALKKVYEQNKQISQQLGSPALLLFALTLIATIPLILMLSGVIPFFATPILMYFLFIAPPSLLFIATIGLAIASFIYDNKASSADILFKKNKQAIAENDKQMEKSTREAQTIEKTNLPNLEAQITKQEVDRDNLITSLKQLQEQSQHVYKKATDLAPVWQSQLPVKEQEPDTVESLGSQTPDAERSSEEEEEEQEALALSPS